jgi:hypothetical protein
MKNANKEKLNTLFPKYVPLKFNLKGSPKKYKIL